MLRYVLSRGDDEPLIAPARRRSALALALRVVFGLGCTEFEAGTDELPDPSTLVQQQAPGVGRDWSCLSQPSDPEVLVNSPMGARPLNQSVQVTDIQTGLVPPGVAVRACAQRDFECSNPLTDSLALDDEGWATLPLYEGFDGYIEITADSLVPTLLIYSDPLSVETQVDATPFALVPRALLPALSAAAGQLQEPDLGIVHLRVFDCQHVAAPGINFSINQPDAWPWYFVGDYPTSDVKETTSVGLGGFINVTPGVALVEAQLSGSGSPIAPAESIIVRSGWMTGMRFVGQALRQ
jgi:hypothetical protein